MKINLRNMLAMMILSSAILPAGSALANLLDCDPRFYLGVEVQGYQNKSIKEATLQRGSEQFTVTLDNNKPFFGKGGAGFSGFIGLRLNPCFGLELGYTGMTTHENTFIDPFFTTKFIAKANNAYLDALGYYALTECLDGIGSLGIGLLTTKISGELTASRTALSLAKASQTKTGAGVRVGLGLGYKFNENFGTRFMLRYQQGNKHIKNITSAALALYFQF